MNIRLFFLSCISVGSFFAGHEVHVLSALPLKPSFLKQLAETSKKHCKKENGLTTKVKAHSKKKITFSLLKGKKQISTVRAYYYKEECLYIDWVATKKKYRKQGHATNLLKILFDASKEQGVECLELWSFKSARPLYEGLGFYKLEDEENLILMRKDL